jgi:hypothetical protein
MRLGGPHNRSGRFEEEINVFSLPATRTTIISGKEDLARS